MRRTLSKISQGAVSKNIPTGCRFAAAVGNKIIIIMKKWTGLDGRYMFVPIAFENLWVPSASTRQLLSNIGRRLVDISGESRKTSVISFRDAQRWYSALTLFCCITLYQIVTARIAKDIQHFGYFPIFKHPSGSWLPTVNNNNNNNKTSATA